MRKEFSSINYIGGLPAINKSVTLTVIVDTYQRRVTFKNFIENGYVDFENIDTVQMDEHKTRSGGKAAVGAIAGGLLTGGIGLIAGAAIGGRKKDASTLSITHLVNGKTLEILLKGKTSDLYAFLSSAITQAEPPGFDKNRTIAKTAIQQRLEESQAGMTEEQKAKHKSQSNGCLIVVLIAIVIIIIIATS